ncbi:MAG: c-type cytochrome [Pirellulaceae bacterium]
MRRLIGLFMLFSLLGDSAKGEETASAPMPADEAAAKMILPEGFQATVFAAEPDVVQPIAMTIDPRGRLWVVECFSYPEWEAIEIGAGRDRVVIFEDIDGDGKHDKRTVFLENGRNLTGIELGFGGVFLCSSPDLIFVPDRDGDDVPDGPGEALLSGFTLKARHNVYNGLHWGPDGWLYGMHGITDTSQVVSTNTPDAKPIPMNCGVWRYHPTRKAFQPYCWGGTNPWGLDWNSVGQAFFTNCVIAHVFHATPGSHFKRMFGNDLNPHVYSLMDSCADHIHWAGGFWDTSIGGKHDDAGGGHAHCGAMIYQGDNWPDAYRDKLYTINIHGRRVNCDRLIGDKHGYVASHDEDMMLSVDPFFRGVELKYGPDGAVYLLDWNDTGECHDFVDIHVETGRIFKIAYGTPKTWAGDLSRYSDQELIDLQSHKNEWFVRTARRILQERSTGRDADASLQAKLWDAYNRTMASQPSEQQSLRMLWLLGACGMLERTTNEKGVVNGTDVIERAMKGTLNERIWAVRLSQDEVLPKTETDSGLLLQEYFARDEMLASVTPNDVNNISDAKHRQRLLQSMWYACEKQINEVSIADNAPKVTQLVARLAQLDNPPLLAQCAAMKLVDIGHSEIALHVAGSPDLSDASRDAMLSGMLQQMRGRDVALPGDWPSMRDVFIRRGPTINPLGMELALLMGDSMARQQLEESIGTADDETALQNLEMLCRYPNANTSSVIQTALADRRLRIAGLRGLSMVQVDDAAKRMIDQYDQLSSDEQTALVNALVSRASYAAMLLDAIESKNIKKEVLTTFAVSQMQRSGNEALKKRLAKIYGAVGTTDQHQRQQIQRMLRMLTDEAFAIADLPAGRKLFETKCAACHKLHGEGGNLGPDLTGGQRKSAEYFLENVISPNTLVPFAYKMRVVQTIDGRVISGVVDSEDDTRIVLQTPTDTKKLVIAKSDIEKIQETGLSLMPERLLDDLTNQQIIDLAAYFQSDHKH